MTKPPKTAVLALRISTEEQERLKELAEAQGQNVSEYVRGLVAANASAVPAAQRASSTGAATNQAVGDQVGWLAGKDGKVTTTTITVSNRKRT